MRAYTHMAFQYGMLMPLSIMLLAVLVPAATSVVATTRASATQGGEENETAIALPGCKAKCGNVTIPYPFGIGKPRCYFGPRFEITCDDGSTEPRLMESRMIVTNISLEQGELEVLQLVNRVCYDAKGMKKGSENQSSGGLSVIPPYTISGDKNRMFVVGCDTYAVLVGGRGTQSYTTGCISKCDNNPGDYADSVAENDTCSGMGCCRTKIPPLLNNLNLTVASFIHHRRVWDFNPCGYAFVVRKDNFTFSNTSFQQLNNTFRLPLVLDWQIEETDCKYAMENGTYACKGNSTCTERPTGYICVCNPGFQGNPYLHDCQDINECTSNPTLCEHGKCINNDGNYTCSCDSGYHNLDNITCIKVPNAKRLKISLGVSLSFSVLVVAILWKYRISRKKKEEYLRRKYFDANGGVLLEKKLGEKARIFTERQVMEATNNYDVNKQVGKGRYGIVYKAVLDKHVVAIKKPQVDDQNQITDTAPNAQKQIPDASTDQKQITPKEQFVNEMTVLYQINHNNVVRLVGCCLDTKTPILVYEFIRNGSLYTRIHGKEGEKPSAPLPLATRLKIAADTAGALAYLHHDSLIKIIHRDVKTANILLDDNLTPKLSDFGASSLLVPEDENKNSTDLVHRSDGYVDPEYLKSKKPLTEKSDVYSFGAVLAELLTGRKAGEEAGEEAGADEKIVEGLHEEIVRKAANLERGMLDQILDKKIVEGHLDKVRKAADLAKRCLNPRGEKRPSMRQVATQLQLLVAPHPSGGGEAKNTGTSAECESSMQITPVGDGQ